MATAPAPGGLPRVLVRLYARRQRGKRRSPVVLGVPALGVGAWE